MWTKWKTLENLGIWIRDFKGHIVNQSNIRKLVPYVRNQGHTQRHTQSICSFILSLWSLKLYWHILVRPPIIHDTNPVLLIWASSHLVVSLGQFLIPEHITEGYGPVMYSKIHKQYPWVKIYPNISGFKALNSWEKLPGYPTFKTSLILLKYLSDT